MSDKKKHVLLGVNVDHVATLRQARYREYAIDSNPMIEPSPLALALASEKAGADGITVHPREDMRHIQIADVIAIRASIKTRLNMEMACNSKMVEHALAIRPDFVCMVPEKREEVSTEGGLNVLARESYIAEAIAQLSAVGISVSLFIDPEPKQIEAAVRVKAPYIELHTGEFANAYYNGDMNDALKLLVSAAEFAHSAGLIVNAGHGINYDNVREIMTIPHLHELNIGHSIISRALMTGIEEAVSKMKSLINTFSIIR